jgi:hypothetical protein
MGLYRIKLDEKEEEKIRKEFKLEPEQFIADAIKEKFNEKVVEVK